MTSTQLERPMSGNTILGAKGITFLGETFIVPQTHDMVKTLFDPNVRKSICELLILALLFANGLVFLFVDSNQARVNVFIGLYVFWRLSYNFGIGWLLNQQSNHHRLVNWSVKSHVFSNDNTSWFSRFIKLEIQSQMGKDYSITEYPIDFNTWLVFRKVVDLILMLDFTTFICLVVACSINNGYQFIHEQLQWLIATRLVVGVILILFNLWVKVNAHNTIKDYAWYWGDFFFRQYNNEELIFDGVFEMFPHPMYSVGYIGYYGFALISKSYTVLIVAVFGHFWQMIFLHFIENPHIDKIYGPSENDTAFAKIIKLKDLKNFDNAKPLVGLWNFNWLRASDWINVIITVTYAILVPLIASTSSSLLAHSVLFYLTLAIKLVESISIDSLLVLQSYYKTFTKYHLSNNIPVEKSLNNWAVLYNSLINLTYSSFFGFNLYLLARNSDILFLIDYLYLRIFLGTTLVLTQVWINTSIIDLIGYFGWFYGDFFIPKSSLLPQRASLTKAGVYRYLNNPEQIFGVCGVLGVTLIVPSFENIVFSLVWVANNFVRINFIEKLHMIKVYGEQEVLQDSGVTKTFKKHLLPELIQRRLSNQERPKRGSISGSIDSFIKDLNFGNAGFNSKLSKRNLLELSQDLYFEKSEYTLEITNLDKDADEGHLFTYTGNPITIAFSAPAGHSPKDWIGLYKNVQTSYSRYKTLISSQGRWEFIGDADKGSFTFDGNKLFWEEGVYEFRLHLDGKHDVAYISQPFEIRSAKIAVPTSNEDVEVFANDLKTLVGKVVEVKNVETVISDLENVIEQYERIARLISKATGIKINSRFLVYESDDNGLTVRKLALKLIHIKKVLSDLSHEQTIDLQKKEI